MFLLNKWDFSLPVWSTHVYPSKLFQWFIAKPDNRYSHSSAVSLKKFIVLIVWVIPLGSSLSTPSVLRNLTANASADHVWTMVLLCLLCCFSAALGLWGNEKTLCGDSPHTLPTALHLCLTTAQALSPKWKKSCRVFCLCQKWSAFLSFVFGSSLAGIFQKVGGNEIMMCVNTFRLYLGMFNVS